MSRTIAAYYEDDIEAQRAIRGLVDLGIQRDNIAKFEGRIPHKLLPGPNISLPQEERDKYQNLLDQGGVLVVVWVMKNWRRAAERVFSHYKPQQMDNVDGRRWRDLRTRT